MLHRLTVLLLLAAPLGLGCASDSEPAGDTGTDSAADTSTADASAGDTAEDIVTEDTTEDTVTPDIGEDAPPADVGEDTTEDTVTPDTREDVPPTDTGEDTSVDVEEDVPPTDTGEDTSVDVEEDTTVIPTPDNHRAEPEICDETRPATEFLPGPDDGGDWPCNQDADCTEGNNGRCSAMPRFGWDCTYDDCFDDAGCGETVCGCGADWGSDANSCYSGDCQVDSDCGDNGFCSPSFDSCGYYAGVVSYFCHTEEDECLNDSDCSAESEGYCMFNSSGDRWVCSYSHCAGK
ncbi:MAG: hypothetical protein ACJAYU_002354 [Bradymonadia bacterium]|jgi:hypothetical protein